MTFTCMFPNLILSQIMQNHMIFNILYIDWLNKMPDKIDTYDPEYHWNRWPIGVYNLRFSFFRLEKRRRKNETGMQDKSMTTAAVITIDTEKQIKREEFILHYPLILAFISFLFSVTLWFTGNQLEGIFVGIWVPSILSLTSVLADIRQSESGKKGTSNSPKQVVD